jgi:ubiquinone/menaquinone biosynthesis C-methylase UbiE
MSKTTLGERLLLALSRQPGTADYAGGTLKTDAGNALKFLEKTVPGFREEIKGKKVLDFGSGFGWQAIAMAKAGARQVVGVDIRLNTSRERARQEGVADQVSFCQSVEEAGSDFDVVVSCSAFEHFDDPEGILKIMASSVRPGGKIIISFAEPWWSPRGSHSNFFTRLPWVNVWFSEKTVMRVRSRFRSDGAQRYQDVQGGLNRMTVARFERIIRHSGLKVHYLKLWACKGLPLVTKIPVLREGFTAAVACILADARPN